MKEFKVSPHFSPNQAICAIQQWLAFSILVIAGDIVIRRHAVMPPYSGNDFQRG
jgi:hypothetical protein